MVVEEEVVFSPTKPAIKGTYYTLASKADRLGNVIFPLSNFGTNTATITEYIKSLIRMDFIEKRQIIIKKDGSIRKLNKYTLKIKNPIEIPFKVYKQVENLSLTDKGLFLSLYAMASDEGYIYSSLKEVSDFFSVSYRTFLTHLNKLQELNLIEKERGVIKVLVR